LRGSNLLGIEEECVWAVPKDTWTDDERYTITEEDKKNPANMMENSHYRDKKNRPISKYQKISRSEYEEFKSNAKK
jgi:hypothetical protein